MKQIHHKNTALTQHIFFQNTVFVDSAWAEVSKQFNEPVADCKKKWRHLRSSLSRYLKSSKDAKNKNQRLKPYYLLNHMEFLIPYTKSLDMTYKNEAPTKYEVESEMEDNENEEHSGAGTSTQISYTTLKPEHDTNTQTVTYTAETVMEDEEAGEELVYETYEYPPKQPQQQQTQQQHQQQAITKQYNIVQQSPQQSNQQSHIKIGHPQVQVIIFDFSSVLGFSKEIIKDMNLSFKIFRKTVIFK